MEFADILMLCTQNPVTRASGSGYRMRYGAELLSPERRLYYAEYY